MRCELLLGTMMAIWKASPLTDRWNCRSRKGVMLRSLSLLPLTPFIFPRYPLDSPLPFPLSIVPLHPVRCPGIPNTSFYE